MGVTIFIDSNSPNKQKYLNGEFDKSIEIIKKAYNNNAQITRATAPLVTDVQILEVLSTQGGYEEVFGKQETSNNHGGELFRVSIGVIGYGGGSYDRATFAGNNAVQLSQDGLDLMGDNIVDGFLDIWDISTPANSNGTFTFTSTSINNAGVSKSISIYIK